MDRERGPVALQCVYYSALSTPRPRHLGLVHPSNAQYQLNSTGQVPELPLCLAPNWPDNTVWSKGAARGAAHTWVGGVLDKFNYISSQDNCHVSPW